MKTFSANLKRVKRVGTLVRCYRLTLVALLTESWLTPAR